VDGYARVTPVAVIEYVVFGRQGGNVVRKGHVPAADDADAAWPDVDDRRCIGTRLKELLLAPPEMDLVVAPADRSVRCDQQDAVASRPGDAGFRTEHGPEPVLPTGRAQRPNRLGELLRIGVTLPLLYLWGMLLVHPAAWLFAPERSEALPPAVLQQGVLSFIISAWCLLLITLAARIERWLADPAGLSAARYAAGWVLGLILVQLWQPMLTGGNASVSFLLLQCAIVIHLSVGITRLDRAFAIPRPGQTCAHASGSPGRDVEHAWSQAPSPSLAHAVGRASASALFVRSMAMAAAPSARGRPSGTRQSEWPAGTILGGDLVRIGALALAAAILASVWGLAGPMLAGVVGWVLIERLLVRGRWRRSGGRAVLLGSAFGVLWLALSFVWAGQPGRPDPTRALLDAHAAPPRVPWIGRSGWAE